MANTEMLCPFCPPVKAQATAVRTLPDGSFSCLQCEAHWRDINQPLANRLSKARGFAGPMKVKEHKTQSPPRAPDVLYTGAKAKFVDDVASAGASETIPDLHTKRPGLAAIAFTAFAATAVLTGMVINFGGYSPGSVLASSADHPLTVDDVTYERSGLSKASGGYVRVKGRIYNGGPRPVQVPDLKLALKDERGETVFSWFYQPGNKALDPNAALRFTSSVSGISGNAGRFDRVDVEVMQSGASSHGSKTPTRSLSQ